MGIAPGGHIDQVVKEDAGRFEWNPSQTKVFNVQILNSLYFKQVTGVPPPTSPISIATYSAYGFPFFAMYEEPSTVAGQFSTVKSIAQMDDTSDPLTAPRVVDITNKISPSDLPGGKTDVGFFNPSGPIVAFVSVRELQEAIRAQGEVLF